MFTLAIGLVVGAVAGAMGYRYHLKRNPLALEALAVKAKELGKKAGF
jgi:hypothetical protein